MRFLSPRNYARYSHTQR